MYADRVAGVTILAPVVNYWWSGLPANLSAEAYNKQLQRDRWALRVAHYAPWLIYWWNTQTLFPRLSVIDHIPEIFSRHDKEIVAQYANDDAVWLFNHRRMSNFNDLFHYMLQSMCLSVCKHVCFCLCVSILL